MTITPARFVAIDSSTLNKLAKDMLGTDSCLRNQAASVLDALQKGNWIPLITLHHVAEMVQHADRNLAMERLQFLRLFSWLAYVKSIKGHPGPATAVDIDAREVRAVLAGGSTLHEIVDNVRDDLFGLSTGKALISDAPDYLDFLRSQAIPQLDEDNQIASIVRSDGANNRHVKLAAMIDSKPRSVAERKTWARGFRNNLEKQLTNHGDKRLNDAPGLANAFTSSVLSDIESVGNSDVSPIERVLALSGLSFADVNPRMTVEDVGLLTNFRANLDVFSSVLRLGRSLSPQEVDQELCPSWRLRREIQRRQNAADRVSGSNLTDAFLIGLTFYASALEVDKRTWEFVRQVAHRDPEISRYTKRCIKCSTYTDLPARLRELDA